MCSRGDEEGNDRERGRGIKVETKRAYPSASGGDDNTRAAEVARAQHDTKSTPAERGETGEGGDEDW